MPQDDQIKFDWLQRIKDAEREYDVVRLASDRLKTEAARDPGVLPKGMRGRDISGAIDNLEGTYVIRLFGEFESSLRSFWSTLRATEPPMRDLIDSLGPRMGVPQDVIDSAHAVRTYRNCLIHERDEVAEPIPVKDSRQVLCKFLSRLPDYW